MNVKNLVRRLLRRRPSLQKRKLGFESLELRTMFATSQINPSQDTAIWGNTQAPYANTSAGAGKYLAVGIDHQTQHAMRAILQFNVGSQIPAGSTITAVTLSVTEVLNGLTGPGPETNTLHKATTAWGEGTSGTTSARQMPPFTTATTNDATWSKAKSPSTSWTTAGGDYSSTVSGSQVIDGLNSNGTPLAYTFNSTSQMVADVQGWLNNPSTNFGWFLVGNESSGLQDTGKMFGSRESSTPPVLTITYTPPTANPTLTVASSHVGNLTQGDSGNVFNVLVTNTGTGASSGTVTVVDTLPTGVTASAASGNGWTIVSGIGTSVVTATQTVALASNQSYGPLTVTVNVANNAPTGTFSNAVTVSGGNSATSSMSDPTTIVGASDLTVTTTHVGNFRQGDSNDVYSIAVKNNGAGATSGLVTVTNTVPIGMTPTLATGTGWTTSILGQIVTATRSDSLAASATYPTLSISVSVASNAAASLTNTTTVAGGGEKVTSNNSASDVTTITPVSDLTIAKTHSGQFRQGDTSDQYAIIVGNSGAGATAGTVTVTDILPTGLTPVSASGTGWVASISGQTVTATRSDALASNSSFTALVITVSVATNAPSSVTNTATVSGGGESNSSNDSATDVTTISGVADLTVTASHTDTFRQGDTNRSLKVVVRNSGASTTSGLVTVTDQIPAGLTATSVTGTGWTTSIQGSTVTATRSDALSAGSVYPDIIIATTVSQSALASISNTVSLTGGGELNATNNSSTDTIGVVQASDLTLAKTHIGNFEQNNSHAVYSIVVTNSGLGATVGQVTVTDTLPTGLTPLSGSGTGWTTSIQGSTFTATRSDVLAASGKYPTLSLIVGVAANAPSSVSNTAVVSGGGEFNTANDSSTDVTTISSAAPDLTIVKTHTGNFRQGDASDSYAITIHNDGSLASSGTVTVTDTLPTGLTLVSAAGTGWTVTTAGGTVTATRSDALGVGSDFPVLTINVGVANNAAASIQNTATVSGGGDLDAANNSATDTVAVIQNSDLTVASSHTGTIRQGDTTGRYSIQVNNVGASSTSGAVTVVDTLPTGLTPTSATGTGWTASISGNVVTATRSDALASSTGYPVLIVNFTVSNNAAASLTNTVTVSGGGDSVTSNNSATDVTAIVQAPDLTIAATHSGTFAQGATSGTVIVIVSNAVNTTASNGLVTVTSTLPTGLTPTSASGSGWTATVAGNVVSATRSDALSAGTSYPALTIAVTAAGNAPLQVTSQVQVAGGGELNTSNNSASDSITITAVADLTIAKTHTGTFKQGDSADTYVVTVSNAGGAATSGTVSVVDTLLAGLTYVSAVGTGWTASVSGSTITATRSDVLAAGSTYPTLTITVGVAATASASINNTATVSGGGETNTANDSATDVTSVTQVADFTILVTHTGTFRQSDTADTISIDVKNSGLGTSSGAVTVTNNLPSGLTPVTAVGTGWTTSINGSTITATRSDALGSNSSYPTIIVTVQVSGSAVASVTNSAQVTGGGEVNTTNNSASETITIEAASASLAGYVFLDASNSGVRVGSNGTTLHGLPKITVSLQQQDSKGNWINVANHAPVQTDANGFYQFTGLVAGAYRLQMTLPAMFLAGKTLPGKINGSTQGSASSNHIDVTLASGQSGTEYDFAIRGMQPKICSRRWSLASTGTIDQIIQQLYST